MSHGRTAQIPTNIPAKGWYDILWRVKGEVAKDNIGLIAAGIAFYTLLALFPAITAVVAIGGLLLEPSQIVSQLQTLSALMPPQAAEILIGQAETVVGSREGGLGLAALLGILLALYSASKGVGSLIEGLNVAYDENERRGFFVLKAVTLGLTLALIFGFLVAVCATIAVPVVLSLFSLGTGTELLVTLGSWSLMLALVLLGLAMIYRYAPCRARPKWQWVSVGAVVACVIWVVASAGFAVYVGNFASYNESFGSLAGIVILLMWLWLTAFIVLLGAELNAEVEAQTRRDTTAGPDEPMGERGAVKADNLGDRRNSK